MCSLATAGSRRKSCRKVFEHQKVGSKSVAIKTIEEREREHAVNAVSAVAAAHPIVPLKLYPWQIFMVW